MFSWSDPNKQRNVILMNRLEDSLTISIYPSLAFIHLFLIISIVEFFIMSTMARNLSLGLGHPL